MPSYGASTRFRPGDGTRVLPPSHLPPALPSCSPLPQLPSPSPEPQGCPFSLSGAITDIRDYSKVCFGGCDIHSFPPILNWPLGEEISTHEIQTNSTTGSVLGVEFNTGPVNLDYRAFEFPDTTDTYVDVPVPGTTQFDRDFSFQFYIYYSQDGVFLDYISDDFADNTTGTLLKGIKFALQNGSIITSVSDGVVESTQINVANLLNNTWYRTIIARDKSKAVFEITIDGNTYTTELDSWVSNKVPSLPGTIRVGGSHKDNSFFGGRFTCLQIVACRTPSTETLYDDECNSHNWPNVTTTTPPKIIPLLPTTSPMSPSTGCRHYTVTKYNKRFSNMRDVLGIKVSSNALACSLHCNQMAECRSFVLKFGKCLLGKGFPATTYEFGSIMYELV